MSDGDIAYSTRQRLDGLISSLGVTSFGDFLPYDPRVAGDGASSWSGSGRWLRFGNLVWFTAVIRFTSAGTGSNNLTITAPTLIDRGNRQVVAADIEGLSPTSPAAHALSFSATEGGAGNTWDRIKNANGNVTAANLISGVIVTVTGVYRAAP